jgi:hypothetical protein
MRRTTTDRTTLHHATLRNARVLDTLEERWDPGMRQLRDLCARVHLHHALLTGLHEEVF